MNRRLEGSAFRALVFCAVVSLVVTGCDSGGGGGSVFRGLVSGVLPSVIDVGTGPAGPPSAPPTVFLDQALDLPFGGPIDAGNFGGLATDAMGNLLEFTGVPAVFGASGIPYNPFRNQTAARASVELRINAPLGALVPSYIVGRHRDRPSVLVIDPLVDPVRSAALGIPTNVGFATSTQYTFRIPPNNQLNISGAPAVPVGFSPLALPVPAGTFAPQTTLSLVFTSGTSTGPNPNPPRLLSIEAASGLPGTLAQPIGVNDAIILTFDQGIFAPSVDLLTNFTVRNRNLGDRIVPGLLTIDPVTPQIVTFTPTPSWGPGDDPMGMPPRGYEIEVSVGTIFAAPGLTVEPITGRPQGSAGTRIPMVESMTNQRVFQTEASPGSVVSLSVTENFSANAGGQTNQNLSPSDTPPFADLDWNGAAAPGVVRGATSTGSALATFNGNPGNLGSRMQVTVLAANQLTPPPPPGLFSPFDDSMGNNLGVNTMGGSHTMQLLEAVDLGGPQDSLELIEWGPANPAGGQIPGPVFASTYPQYQAWCGMTNVSGGLQCSGSGVGLTPLYVLNYDVTNIQTVDPTNANTSMGIAPNAGGVLVSVGQAAYTTPQATALYYPFPTFNPPFDYTGGGVNAPNLLWEVNIEPGMQVANFNRFRATAFNPIRRNIGQALGSGINTAQAGGCETYDNRFTFVRMVANGESLAYDTGSTSADYSSLQIIPDPTAQPQGTSSRWRFRGANMLAGPSTLPNPGTLGATQWLTYFNGGPEQLANPLILNDLDGNRYFVFDLEIRNNNLTNETQEYTSLIMGVLGS